MAGKKRSKNVTTENNQALFRYAIVILALSIVFILIPIFNYRIAFVEKPKMPPTPIPEKINPTRGNIYAAGGELMATTIPKYRLYMDFLAEGFKKDSFLRSKRNGVDSLAFCLSKKFKDRSPESYKRYLLAGFQAKQPSREYSVYGGRLSYSDLKEVKRFPFFRYGRNASGLYEKEMTERQKLFGTLASRTIGGIYGDLDSGYSRGSYGLELQYDSLLRGEPGVKSKIRIGQRWVNVVEKEPQNGYDLLTTIDVGIQDIAERALINNLTEFNAVSGTVVVMEVNTGEIKAITNMDRISSGVYQEGVNHAVRDEIEPGSTMKVAAIMVALDDGLCKPDDVVDIGNGIWQYNKKAVKDWNAGRVPKPRITVEEAIWNSSNVGVAKTIVKGYREQPSRFTEGLNRVGIDADLKLEIQGAGHAKIRTPKDKEWSNLTLAWESFGYEVRVPPIYMLTFYNAIANNGKMVRPIFTKAIMKNGEVVQRFSTETLRSSICSRTTLNTVRDMLEGVIERGTGKPVHSEVVSIAGKTGTAQIAQRGGYSSHNVSFCGYFPADKPKYSCIVVVNRPSAGPLTAGIISGGVFKTIAEKITGLQQKLDLQTMEADSAKIDIPDVKSGNTAALKSILDEFSIPSDIKQTKSEFMTGERNKGGSKLEIKELTVKEGLVPRVVGMGAKDAVYLLEKSGLQVRLSGKGQVISQSIAPGQKIVRGQTVSVVLKD
ncbi:MAG: PASTA domain-containing protein [Tannerella sp.]|jgi:cell division protein FtsI (penicillin-binding protein 3)|nr:PASTA domain-containing protein [Tannerella sp.]